MHTPMFNISRGLSRAAAALSLCLSRGAAALSLG